MPETKVIITWSSICGMVSASQQLVTGQYLPVFTRGWFASYYGLHQK